MISYTLDTRRARSEVRGQRAQSQLLTELVATASNDQNRDQQIGRTLFNLLVPVELEPYLAGSGEMQIELDPQTAKIPWELLDTKSESDDELPWAIRVKLLRKLRIREFRERVSDASPEASALVIGEPACPPEYPRLLGARSEALAVRGCLTGDAALNVTDLISEDPSEAGATAREVVNALFEKPWRIVHIAGHGVPGGERRAGRRRPVERNVPRARRVPQHAHGSRARVRELLPPGRRRCRAAAEHALRPRRVRVGRCGRADRHRRALRRRRRLGGG